MQNKREIPAIVNEKINDLVHDFMNFNALKIILKIHKKKLRQIQAYMQDMREIPAIVTEKIVIKC